MSDMTSIPHDVTVLEDHDASLNCLTSAEPKNDELSLIAESANKISDAQLKSAMVAEVFPAIEQQPHLVYENSSESNDVVQDDEVIPDIQDRSNALNFPAVDQRCSLLSLREQPLRHTTSMSETCETSCVANVTATNDAPVVKHSDHEPHEVRAGVMMNSELEGKEDELTEDVFSTDAGSPSPVNEHSSGGVNRSNSALGSIAEEVAVEPSPCAAVDDVRSTTTDRLVTESLNGKDKLCGFVAGFDSGESMQVLDKYLFWEIKKKVSLAAVIHTAIYAGRR